MGSNCSCCSSDLPKTEIDTKAFLRNPDWTDAVTTGKLGGVRMLHAENPDLINEAVDKFGHQAIHIAVINKNIELLKYVLNNGANVNARGGPDRNTALHEAVKLKDIEMVRQLFAHGIDDSIPNKRNQKAIDLCHRSIKRDFLKAKQYKNKHRQRLESNSRPQSSDIIIAGMSLDSTSREQIHNYVKKTDHAQNFYRDKKQEIETREIMLTAFGEDVGCEVDEIALMLQKLPDPAKMWQRFAKKPALTRQNEVKQLLHGLTITTLRKKNPVAPRPPVHRMKELTLKVVRRLPKKRGKMTWTQQDFVKDCHTMLYKIHDEIVKEDMHAT